MKLLRYFVLALALGAALLLVTDASGAGGASAPGSAVLRLSTQPNLDAKGHKVKGQLLIVANLTAADGKPLGNETITFFERVNFAGADREAMLGTAVTDSSGVAAIVYLPAQVGKHTLAAQFAGDATAAQANTTSTVQVSDVTPLFPATTVPLASVRHWLSISVLIIVVAVWVFLASLVLRVVFGIRSAGAVTAVSSEIPEYLRTSQGD